METKRLPLVIPLDLYERLAEKARLEERDVLQQARHLLRRALEETAPPQEPEQPRAS